MNQNFGMLMVGDSGQGLDKDKWIRIWNVNSTKVIQDYVCLMISDSGLGMVIDQWFRTKHSKGSVNNDFTCLW